ncbi:MAG: hypothetical protein AABY15_00405 [Nanoarchaeota archaeon]
MSNKKEIRRKFREDTFDRDGYCCKWCGNGSVLESPESFFDAHHITDRNEMPNGGYVPENGITLCKFDENGLEEGSCHMKAEKFHISGGEEWEEGMHPDDLYKLIGSSKELAIEKSEKIKI